MIALGIVVVIAIVIVYAIGKFYQDKNKEREEYN